MPTKLIEVALPLDVINKEAAREKSIRHGHPSTLHLWWARRPLAACRAVLFAQLVDDPSAHPDRFPTEEAQDIERQRLFRIIEQLVVWENISNRRLLDEALFEIHASLGESLPTVVDPFAGGGSIPLEAQRLGLPVAASDLNPVAVLLNKAMVEIPPQFANRPPVNQHTTPRTDWSGSQGLVADIRYYAEWMNAKAAERIGKLYPTTALPDGRPAPVIAWLWARTVTCQNPACRATIPLVNSYAMSRRRGREAWLEPEVSDDRSGVHFKIVNGPGCPTGGTVSRTGAKCLVCGSAVPLTYVRSEGKAGRMGAQLLCTIAAGHRRRIYLEAERSQVAASEVDRPEDVPETQLPYNPRAFTTNNYGISEHWQLFTNRQLVALTTFSNLVAEAHEQVLADGGEEAYAGSVATYLALAVDRLANRCSSQSFWHPGGEKVEQVFARNALPMIWVYAEANPFSEASGNFLGQVDYLANAVERLPATGTAMAVQLDATSLTSDRSVVICTDPPYYDNVPYADLSDFFYVWLRRTAGPYHSELFKTMLVPKAEELIAEPARQGSWAAAAEFFERGLRGAFKRMLDIQQRDIPLTIFYAFKQADTTTIDGAEQRASTGWETMLEGLLGAGAMISGTWPVRTEQPGGLREVGRNALASSIVLVCRPRTVDAGVTDRRTFLNELRQETRHALRTLQKSSIAPVDMAQAAIGPGIAVFSRYSKVIEPTGASMSVRTALQLINQVLDEVTAEQEGEFDEDTRWAIAWYAEFGMDEGPYGRADDLSRAKNVSVDGLEKAGIVKSGAGKVRLLERGELDHGWDPATDTRLTVWEITQHLIRRLLDEGDASAGELLARVGGLGDAARDLAYRLFQIAESKKWAKEAGPYNALAAAWPELSKIAASGPAGQQSLV